MRQEIGFPAYVINLRRRADRREWISQSLPRGLTPRFTTWWDGPFDGDSLHKEDLDGIQLFPWRIESDNPWWGRPLKAGEIACALAHLACWEDAERRQDDHVVVLEDDARFVADFDQRLAAGLAHLSALDPEWEFVYLGRLALGEDERVSQHFVRPNYSHCSYGYVIRPEGRHKLLRSNLRRGVIPIDEFLPAMYCPHPRLDVRELYPPQLRAYAFDPSIVTQLPKAQWGSDTEGTDFIE